MAFPTVDEALYHLRIDLDGAPLDWAGKQRIYVEDLLADAIDYVKAYCRRNMYSTQADLDAAENAGAAGADPMVAGGDVRRAILMLIGAWNENREAVNVGNIVNEMPFGVRAILDRYRKGMGV